ncbi:MAG: hypothetical protein IKP06_03940 [Elusimicrobiaceae bacterium]|nr:hypothetical protein [Elusimicrobiaceae bacterium]
MLQRSDVRRILTDLYRTELSHFQPEASVNCRETAESLWARIPLDIKQKVDSKASVMFGYPQRSFSLFERMLDYCYASFLKNGQLFVDTILDENGQLQQRAITTEMMWKESREIAVLFPDTKRIISLVSSNDWYGFTCGIELPHILQVPVIYLPDQPAQEWNVELQAGDLVVATPKFWNYWLRCGNQFPSGVEVVCGTDICSKELLAELTAVGAARVTELYGSSQTGALGFRIKGSEMFEMFSFWNISLSQGAIRAKRSGQTEWITLSPQVKLGEDRQFQILEGVPAHQTLSSSAVSPFFEHVEQVLASHPAVRACRVRPLSSLKDSRLEAVVSLHEGYTPSHLGIIRSFLRQHLPSTEIPETFTFEKPSLASATVGK